MQDRIWKQQFSLEAINELSSNTLSDHIGIEFTETGDDFLSARMPVDQRTKQPMGLLHGGANVVLAETLTSVASVLCLDDPSKQTVVGLEINANHLRAVTEGWVTGTCKPVRIGRTIHVWNIEIHDQKGRLSCVSRITIAIIDRK
jgi:1,4-dihydroxy-2-naphthoyl-CoA hydrolase